MHYKNTISGFLNVLRKEDEMNYTNFWSYYYLLKNQKIFDIDQQTSRNSYKTIEQHQGPRLKYTNHVPLNINCEKQS